VSWGLAGRVVDDLRLVNGLFFFFHLHGHFHGRSTELTQKVDSLEIEHKKQQAVKAGQEVALKVDEPVRAVDMVYKVVQN
jgi:hypothetical protein